MPTSTRNGLVRFCSALFAATLVAVFAPTVLAGGPQAPPTLSGEVLAASGDAVSVTCTGTVEGFTISFRTSGTALGQYPGTFTESGSHIGPGLDVITARFTITSGSTVITGTKTFVPNAPASTTGCGGAIGPGTSALLTYEATITGPNHLEFRDEGTADTQFLSFAPSDPPTPFATFSETFRSALTAPTVVLPGKGCGDENHEHQRQGDCP
jgi:hypothetical protein